MTNDRNCLHETGLKEALVFLALLIPTFLVIAAAAATLVRPDQPSLSVAAMTIAVCGPCHSYEEEGY
jgi:hypothetical protein